MVPIGQAAGHIFQRNESHNRERAPLPGRPDGRPTMAAGPLYRTALAERRCAWTLLDGFDSWPL